MPPIPLRLFVSCLALCPGLALAQDAEGAGPSWTIEGTIGTVSDYRFRGLSLSGGDPAVQGGLTASHASGFYGDAWVSSIEEYGLDADGDGAKIELTLTAGWASSAAGFDFDVAVSTYQYPDGSDVNAFEIPVQASRSIGPATWTVGAAWAPEQSALDDEDNRYVWAGLDYAPEAWPISLSASVGHEDGAWAPGGKTDWRAGAFLPVGPVTAGAEWIDTDVDDGELVLSLFAAF